MGKLWDNFKMKIEWKEGNEKERKKWESILYLLLDFSAIISNIKYWLKENEFNAFKLIQRNKFISVLTYCSLKVLYFFNNYPSASKTFSE